MELIELITNDIKKAMLAKDKIRLEALRGIKKELLEAQTAKGSNGVVTEEAGLKILQKMVKQRKESAIIYIEQNRSELAEGETAEADIISEYLPKTMSDEELTACLKEIITKLGINSAKEMGKVMGVASKQLAGKADGRAISEKVKQLLG